MMTKITLLFYFLYRYLKKFQQSGITGKDLLIMEEKEFVQQLGIDLANHRKRFSLHLLKLQNYHEKHVTERLYYEMEMLYQERLLLEVRGSSPYQLPLSISTWKTFDIFVFLKLSGNEHLEKFLKPVALSELTGEQLLLISLPETEVCAPRLLSLWTDDNCLFCRLREKILLHLSLTMRLILR